MIQYQCGGNSKWCTFAKMNVMSHDQIFYISREGNCLYQLDMPKLVKCIEAGTKLTADCEKHIATYVLEVTDDPLKKRSIFYVTRDKTIHRDQTVFGQLSDDVEEIDGLVATDKDVLVLVVYSGSSNVHCHSRKDGKETDRLNLVEFGWG